MINIILRLDWSELDLRKVLRLFKYIIRSAYKSLVMVPLGLLYCFIKFRDKDTHYLIPANSIGDIIYSLAYLPEYRKLNNLRHVTLVGVESKKKLFSLYKHTYNELCIIELKWLQRIFKSQRTNFGFRMHSRFKNITIIHIGTHFPYGLRYIARYPGIKFVDYIKYSIYGLKENPMAVLPVIPDYNIGKFVKDLDIKKGKTVILNPYALSIKPIDIKLFDAIAEQLIKSGFTVLTNISNDKQVIVKGTKALKCDLIEILHIANYCGYIIGLRSGFLDLMLFAKCKIVALYPADSIHVDFFDISVMDISKKFYQYKLIDNFNKDVQNILSYIE